jgi:hypothetical protein
MASISVKITRVIIDAHLYVDEVPALVLGGNAERLLRLR